LASKGVELIRVGYEFADSDNFNVAHGEIFKGPEGEKDTRRKDPPDVESTITLITPLKINLARKFKRSPTQIEVMNGNSAADIAIYAWKQASFKFGAEWLHRSAYSYGGLNTAAKPNSSQVMENLVLGSEETNTRMLRYETFIKRFVARQKVASVNLTTTLVYGGDWQRPRYAWCAPKLRYVWETNLGSKPLNDRTTSGDVEFNLAERKVPMIFEMLLDRVVEDKVYGWGKA